MSTFVSAGILIFLASLVLTKMMMLINIRDIPNERSSHSKPTPKSGGIAIAVAFMMAVSAFYGLQDGAIAVFEIAAGQFVLYVGLGVFILMAALVDDLWDVLPHSKFAAQFIAALIFVLTIAKLETLYLPFLGQVELGGFGYVLTVLWIVFFMNAYNFMDGINGIAGGTAFIAVCFLGYAAWGAGTNFVALCSLCLALSIPGFLVFNFPKGFIFLGDTGSQFIGFLLSTLAVLSPNLNNGELSFYIVPIVFLPFIFDVVVTLLYRLLRRQNVLKAHREHLYQIGTKIGYEHPTVSFVYFGLFVLCGIDALLLQARNFTGFALLLMAILAVLTSLAYSVYKAGLEKGVVEALRPANAA